MSPAQIQLFQFEEDQKHFANLTTINIDGDIWFVAIDVCKLLEIQNATIAIQWLDEDEKLDYVLHRSGQERNVKLISESGLYALIFKSRKESAKTFRKWVTKEVIPSIRKTWAYWINRLETVPYFQSRVITLYSIDVCMQYTWLKDKKWVEIYEGDIIEQTLNDWIKNKRIEVIWRDWGFFPLTLYALECTIIWNIYQNPELLK